jgi:type I restriction enzyme M protein
VERLQTEYADAAARLVKLKTELKKKLKEKQAAPKTAAKAAIEKLKAQTEKARAKIAERDEKIAEARRRAEDDRRDVETVGRELTDLYGDADELLKHARVVGLDEIEENEFNLNIPRYVDTFEPEPRVAVKDALKQLKASEQSLRDAETKLQQLLKVVGYDFTA